MEYTLIDRKTVYDADGFTTEYSWYKCPDGENIFIFGDSDWYTPENEEPDYETSDDDVAREWFDSYEGFTDDEMNLDEDLDDVDVVKTTDGSEVEGYVLSDKKQFVDANGECHPMNDAGEVIMDEILDEGIGDLVGKIKQKLTKNPVQKALDRSAKQEKKIQSKALKVLAKDFDFDHKDAKYFPDHDGKKDFKKPIDYRRWKDMYGSEMEVNDPKYAEWYNAIVLTPDNYYIRKGAEDFSSKLVRCLPGKNDNLNSLYEFRPTEELSNPDENSGSSEDPEAAEAKAAIGDLSKNESLLTEEPIITLTDDEITDPKEFDLKKAIQKRVDQEKDQKAAEEEARKRDEENAKIEQLKAFASKVIDEIKDSADPLDTAFAELVPSSGAAETVAGEITRAMMRILYRWYNDGDMFFFGEGLETCGGSTQYLMETLGETFSDHVYDMLSDALKLTDDESEYEAHLDDLKDIVINYLLTHEDTFYTLNKEDSRDHNYDILEENQPKYDFEIEGSDDIYDLIQYDIIDSDTLYEFVEQVMNYDSTFKGAEVQRPWAKDSTSIEVTDLTSAGLETLKDWTNNIDNFWEDLTSEYEDELEKIHNGEYDMDDLDDIDEEE